MLILITLIGKATWNEFQKALSAIGVKANEARSQFERLDADGDGDISWKGFSIYMKAAPYNRANSLQNIIAFSDSSVGRKPGHLLALDAYLQHLIVILGFPIRSALCIRAFIVPSFCG